MSIVLKTKGSTFVTTHDSSIVRIAHLSSQGMIKCKVDMATKNVEVEYGNATFLISHNMSELANFANDYIEDLFLMRGFNMISYSKSKELKHSWVKLNLDGLQIQYDRALMLLEMTSLIEDANEKIA